MLDSYDKHFLDSSVTQPMLFGSEVYREYFKKHFGDERLYISNYVQMEFLRSFVIPLLNFYFTLDLPNIRTISDALALWSNSFKTRELKAIIRLMSIIFRAHVLDFSDPKDKEKALREIGRIIRRCYAKIKRRFHNIGDRGTRCERARIELRQRPGVNDKQVFSDFQGSFLDLTRCQSNCALKRFLCERYKSEVERYAKAAGSIRSSGSKENVGFVKISEKLNQVLQKNTNISCKLCEMIGDAVIALEAPDNMLLEHTDYSFDHLCELINKPHRRHPSEIAVSKTNAR